MPEHENWPWGDIDEKSRISVADNLPKITIVTCSYNQGQFLEATILSVLKQHYPNLEYIVIDGGSTDNSVDIIKKYSSAFTHWRSEPDNGQSHAINKGFALATGDILGWLNSDDMLAPGALYAVSQAWAEMRPDVLTGNSDFVDENGNFERHWFAQEPRIEDLLTASAVTAPQPSTFWSRECWRKYGPLDEDFHWVMDYALWVRMAAGGVRWSILNKTLSLWRHHEDQKTKQLTRSVVYVQDTREMLSRFIKSDLCNERLRKLARYGIEKTWIKQWRKEYDIERMRTSFAVYWLRKGIGRRQCFWVREYYGTLLRRYCPILLKVK